MVSPTVWEKPVATTGILKIDRINFLMIWFLVPPNYEDRIRNKKTLGEWPNYLSECREMYYFLSKSLISVRSFSSLLGSTEGTGVVSLFLFILLMALIKINNASAVIANEIIVDRKFPYLIAVPGITSSDRLVSFAAFSAGVKIAGVIISSTTEVIILLN